VSGSFTREGVGDPVEAVHGAMVGGISPQKSIDRGKKICRLLLRPHFQEDHMRFVNVRELKAKASEYLSLAEKGENVIIVSRGKPRAALLPLNEDELEDFVLANHPRFRRMIEKSLRSYRKEGGIPIEDLLKDAEKTLARRGR
jgi:prevent-host-death family protein